LDGCYALASREGKMATAVMHHGFAMALTVGQMAAARSQFATCCIQILGFAECEAAFCRRHGEITIQKFHERLARCPRVRAFLVASGASSWPSRGLSWPPLKRQAIAFRRHLRCLGNCQPVVRCTRSCGFIGSARSTLNRSSLLVASVQRSDAGDVRRDVLEGLVLSAILHLRFTTERTACCKRLRRRSFGTVAPMSARQTWS